MENINLFKLSTLCQNEKREAYEKMSDTKYAFTIFVAITEDNQVLVSRTAHILEQAEKCILIHARSSLAITKYYLWYDVQFINESGIVFENALDDEFTLEVGAFGAYANQIIALCADGTRYFSAGMPCDNSIVDIWNLYQRLKASNTRTERELISELFRRDKKILELEKQVEDFTFKTHLLEEEKSMYKGLLDEIQNMIRSNQDIR